MATDPHLEAMEVSAGVVALRAWIATQSAALSWAERIMVNRLTDAQLAEIVNAIVPAVDTVRDTNAPTPAQAQESAI
jgi:hypothetical protein